MNNDLISREALKRACSEMVRGSNNSDFIPCPSWNDAMDLIDNAPTVEMPKQLVLRDDVDLEQLIEAWSKGTINITPIVAYTERPQGEWNTHQVACILAELFGDTCACNHCGIDEWLPKKCDFANKECPDVVGVACWEQFLKHRAKGEEE